MPIKVLVTDDHEIVRQGLKSLLSTIPDIELVGEANSAAEAVRRTGLDSPDVVLMDA
jgi:DNA-binding NarL/FixJ family response regulator